VNEWTSLESLQARLKENWPAFSVCRERSASVFQSLSDALSDIDDAAASVIVTGSLGRGEVTDGSDVDWLLLVDGLSNPDHGLLLRQVSERIGSVIKKDVGRTKTFADLVVSHQLIHYIAGTRDTNENLTRRILMLSESRAITGTLVRQRVIRNILERYVIYDRSVRSKTGNRQYVPHFLLNDVVRYWRTMASDYASKMWERQGEGWGIRNVKLRFSRKLLFIWGLLASFSGELFELESLQTVENEEDFLRLLAEVIRGQTDVPPLELLARAVNQGCSDDTARGIFSSYNQFLGTLSVSERRAELESVAFEEASDNATFDELRELSGIFRQSVNKFFFDEHPRLPKLIRDYGVF